MSDTEPCPPMDNDDQLEFPFVEELTWRSELEGQRLSLPNPPSVPCFCTSECHLNSHRKP